MKKAEFIDVVASKSNLSKKDATTALNAVLETIEECLVKKEEVAFIGFGTFTTSERAARVARIPGNGKEVPVPATTVAKFKVGKNLKDAVAGKK